MLDQTSRDKNFGVGRKMQNAIPGARYTTFRELFKPSGTNDPVRFSIPQYQRSYDWRTEPRRDLFNDLERLAAMQHDTTGDPAQKGLPTTSPKSSPASNLKTVLKPQNRARSPHDQKPSNTKFDNNSSLGYIYRKWISYLKLQTPWKSYRRNLSVFPKW